jgi:hypothetical protein
MVSNMTQICINIDTPVVSIDEFVRRTGLSIPTVRRQISEGMIPIMPRATQNSKISVNMIGYLIKCAQEANLSIVKLG